MEVASIEKCSRGHRVGSSGSHSTWKDILDPDNMTFEELVELGGMIGIQSRRLCSELLTFLPVSKYKTKLFSRKKTETIGELQEGKGINHAQKSLSAIHRHSTRKQSNTLMCRSLLPIHRGLPFPCVQVISKGMRISNALSEMIKLHRGRC